MLIVLVLLTLPLGRRSSCVCFAFCRLVISYRERENVNRSHIFFLILFLLLTVLILLSIPSGRHPSCACCRPFRPLYNIRGEGSCHSASSPSSFSSFSFLLSSSLPFFLFLLVVVFLVLGFFSSSLLHTERKTVNLSHPPSPPSLHNSCSPSSLS